LIDDPNSAEFERISNRYKAAVAKSKPPSKKGATIETQIASQNRGSSLLFETKGIDYLSVVGRTSKEDRMKLRPLPRSADTGARLGLLAGSFYDCCMIRSAVRNDAAMAVPLILQAIGHIAFVLSGTAEAQETESILKDFFRQEGNRMSYQNTLVMEEDGEVVGVAIFYDGAKARGLDEPLERAAAKKSGHSDYCIPTEPEASEFYMDTLSVSSGCQGKGYGSLLIEAGYDRARKLGHLRMALLVEVDSARAKRLYERVGFRADYTKWIVGQEYFHMVRTL
jgi:ribosomal protein S18 acetylase RimI-like enzyme